MHYEFNGRFHEKSKDLSLKSQTVMHLQQIQSATLASWSATCCYYEAENIEHLLRNTDWHFFLSNSLQRGRKVSPGSIAFPLPRLSLSLLLLLNFFAFFPTVELFQAIVDNIYLSIMFYIVLHFFCSQPLHK